MDITSTLQDYHLLGLVIGICTFLVIGLFHPVVVKCEYHYGTSCWWWFLLLGCACTIPVSYTHLTLPTIYSV